MFKYLCDKNDIVKSYTGIKGIYERIKFKFEKRNTINNFIKNVDIDQYVILDFINMVQKFSPNKNEVFPLVLYFSKYNLLYNTFTYNDMIILEVETREGNNTHYKISIKIYLDDNKTDIIISNKTGVHHYSNTLSEIKYDEYKIITMLKKYMLYLFENILDGGDIIEAESN